MTNNITIPRELASELLGELEQMASLIDSEWGDNREPSELIGAGDMPRCYYLLRLAFVQSSPNDDLIDIERD